MNWIFEINVTALRAPQLHTEQVTTPQGHEDGLFNGIQAHCSVLRREYGLRGRKRSIGISRCPPFGRLLGLGGGKGPGKNDHDHRHQRQC